MFASLVLLMAAAKKKPIETSASSGHITNLKQFILETFDIYGCKPLISHINKTSIGNGEVKKLNEPIPSVTVKAKAVVVVAEPGGATWGQFYKTFLSLIYRFFCSKCL